MSSIDIKAEGSLLILTVSGDMPTDKVIAIISEYYPNGIVKDVIWDFTNGSLLSTSQSDFIAIAEAVKKSVANGARKSGKTVFVGSIDVEYGLLRMYTVIADMSGVPVPYSVFRSMDQAINWINEQNELL
jgi:hypothetical protein